MWMLEELFSYLKLLSTNIPIKLPNSTILSKN